MKRVLSLAILLGLVAAVFGSDFDASQTVPVRFTVPNPSTDTLLQGTPFDPDSIFATAFDSSSTTIRRPRSAMTKWNGQTGEYVWNFNLPDDSTAIYSVRFEVYYPGFSLPVIAWKLVNAVNFYDVSQDTTAGEQIIIGYSDRIAAWLGCPCDISFQRMFPLGSRPKDSTLVYCVSDDLADTTLYARIYYQPYSAATKDSSGFKKE